MRLHTNILTASDVYTAVRGTPVSEYAWKHLDAAGEPRDFCGYGHRMGDPVRGCAYVLDGTDTDGTDWHRCTTHDDVTVGEPPVCGAYGQTVRTCDHGTPVGYVATGRRTYSAPVDVIGNLPGVDVDVAARGSRSHVRSLDVYLTGTSSRRPNNRGAHGGYDYAATWDEWGMFLARLYAADPAMVAGTVARPIYANAEHFRWATAGRFDTLTPAQQHGGVGHRWEYDGWESVTGSYVVHTCARGKSPCGAVRRFAVTAGYLADNGMTVGA